MKTVNITHMEWNNSFLGWISPAVDAQWLADFSLSVSPVNGSIYYELNIWLVFVLYAESYFCW